MKYKKHFCFFLIFLSFALRSFSQLLARNDFDFTARDYITLSESVANNDDLPAGQATFTFLNEPHYGEIAWTNASTGEFEYDVPPTNFLIYDHRYDTIRYQVCVNNQCDTAILGIWLDHLNNQPITPNDYFHVEAGSTRFGDVSLNDSEPDSISDPLGPDNFYYILTYPAQGTLHSMNLDGIFSYTAPSSGFSGTVSFTYTAIDLCGAHSDGIVFLTIVGNNENPMATSPAIQTIDEDLPSSFNLAAYASDPENDPLIYSKPNLPSIGNSVIQSNGNLLYTPLPNFIGYDTLYYTITDIVGQSDTGMVIIHVINTNNDAPSAIAQTAFGVEDTNLSAIVYFADEIDGDILTYSILSPPGFGSASISADGILNYSPAENFWGTDEIQYLACDQQNLCDSEIISISISPVNDAPELNPDYNEILINGVLNGNLSMNATDVDNPSNTLTFAIVDSTINGNLSLLSNGSYTYTPTAFFHGTDSLRYSACDNEGACSTGILYLTITLVNLPPEASPVSFNVNEDQETVLHLDDSTFDFGNGDLTYSIINNNSIGSFANLTNVGLAFQPPANTSGNYIFNYSACDTGGLCDTSQINIQILPVNDAPVATYSSANGNEDMIVTLDPIFSDIDSESLQFSIISAPEHGVIIINEYLPYEDFFGTDIVQYQVCDDLGLCDTAQIQITISPVNDSPIAENDEVFGSEDSWLEANIGDNDLDIDSPYLTYTLIESDNPSNINLSTEGMIQWLPPANFYGAITISYETCDPLGACDSASTIIHIESVNDVPTANYPEITVTEDSSTDFQAVLFASDIENQAITQSIVSEWQINAVFNSETGSAFITTSNDYYGNAFAVISTCDSDGACSNDTLFVQITPVNDAPSGNSETLNTFQNTTLSGSWYNYVFDIDDAQLSFSETMLHGSTVTNSVGQFVYTPAENFIGQDTLWLEVCDSSMACVIIPFYVNVLQPNQPPVVSNTNWSICQGETVTIPLATIAGDEIESASELDYSLSSAINATFTVDHNNELIQIVPPSFYTGEMLIDIQVCDHASPSLCSTGVITLEVTATTTPVITSVSVNNITCNGLSNGSIALNEVIEETGVLYVWENGSTDSAIDNLAPGTYSVELIGLSECANSTFAEFAIYEPDEMSVELISQINDEPFSVFIESIVAGGTSPYAFAWSGPDNFTSNSPNLDSLNLSGEYFLQVTDANNCISEASLNITSLQSTTPGDFVIYPNPSSGNQITIQWPSDLTIGTEWKMFDSIGNLVAKNPVTSAAESVNTTSLRTGVYYIVSNYNGVTMRSPVTIIK